MKATGNRTAWVRKAVAALFAAMLLGLALAPAGANAEKVDNPSPPNFRMEITGGFLQFIGTAGTPLQLPFDFAEYDPPLPNPSIIGTVTTNANGYGVINAPNASYANCALSNTAGVCFPPIPVNVDDIALTVKILPVSAVTGLIDPLSGRVDLNLSVRLKAEGAALGFDLGNNCYIGSVGNPVVLNTTTNVGTFPTVTPPPAQNVAVADFVSDGSGYAGGWLAAEPYSDEAGEWASGAKLVPGFPIGGTKPTPAQIPLDPLTDFIPRAEGSWRGVNETVAAPAATDCGGSIVTGQVNDLIGLPSAVGASTASFDFKFAQYSGRIPPNHIVNKAVKSKFVASGISSEPWPSTQVPTAVSSQSVSIDASTSYFKIGGNASERYQFDLGTGSFGAWTTNPVANFNAPFIASGGNPITLPIRVRVKDTSGDTDVTTRRLRVVPATDITLDTTVSSIAGDGNFRGGSEAHVNFAVTNSSDTDNSSQSIAFDASLPAGVSLTNLDSPAAWSCNTTASSIACTIPQGALGPDEIDIFDATVDVATNAANPSNIDASAVMNGDPDSGNNITDLNVPVLKTDLTVDVSRTDPLVANGWFPYSVAVTNVGDGLTVGGSSVDVDLPSDFTYRAQGSGGSGWTCNPVDPQNITCDRSGEIAGSSAAPVITIWARVDRNTPAEDRTVTATVSTQGDIGAFGGSNTDGDTGMVQILPDLAADASITGDYIVGDPGTVTFSATNESVLPIDGPTTITSTLPAGLTVTAISGTGWDCSATVLATDAISCVHAAGLAAAETSASITATVAVAQAAYPGVTVPVAVDNDDDGFALNDTDSADVQVRRLDIAIQKLAVKPFNVGIEGRYRLNVTNTGDAATVGPITVLDTLPVGLELKGVSGAGWDCSTSTIGGQDVECVLTGTLGAGIQAAPIEIRVDVLDEAAQAGTVVNTAYADTDRDTRGVPEDAAITANNESTISTTAVAVDLSIESRHQGDFLVGTEDLYSLDIRNVGFFGTDEGESVTVTDDLPDGIVPLVDDIEATRPGWTCVEDTGDVTCTLEAPDALSSAMEPESSVTIDIPVQVTDAAADSSDNVAEVSTARDSNPALSPNNIATDPTSVKRIDLELSGDVSIPPRAGGIGEVTIGVDNIGSGATVEPTSVVAPLAAGTSYRPTGSTTTGWNCSSPGAGTQITCIRSQSIPAGGSAPDLKLRTNVSTSAPADWDTELATSTNIEPTERLANNMVTLDQTLETIDLEVSLSHNPAAVQAGKRAQMIAQVENLGNTATASSSRVEVPVNASFTDVAASGPGWNCNVTGNNVVCTRTASIPAGGLAPDITIGFDIPSDQAGTRNTNASVSSNDDPFTGNDSTSMLINIVATADVTVTVDQPTIARVGDNVTASYDVRNIGTDETSGAPGVTLRISMSNGLIPVGAEGATGDWDCNAVAATESTTARFDCDFTGQLGAGDSSTVNADFEVVPTSETSAETLAVVRTVGDINRSNDFDSASSLLSGVDLEATVAAAPSSTEHMIDGVTATRVVSIVNSGTSATTGPITVSSELPVGVQWDSGVSNGSGWTCTQVVRNLNCSRSDQFGVGQSLPDLSIGLRASKQNAPSVQIAYTVSTTGDENAENNTASRTEEVRYFPDTAITSAPTGQITVKSGSVEFNSPDSNVTFECQLDTGTYAACTSPYSVTGLSNGVHSVQVRAVNEFGMADATPASASWEIIPVPKTGPSIPITADSTGGTLTLAALGSVDLPENQVSLEGRLFTNSGGITIPAAGVEFAPVVQTIPDALGPGTNVDVEISITATGEGDGVLPNGGGAASFVLPVRADVQASLAGSPVLPPGEECSLKPITFDLVGTYDEGAGTTHLEQTNVSFPQVTGCGAFKGVIDQLLELPRNDIEMALDFNITKGEDEVCPDGTTGVFPDCVPVVTPKKDLAKVVVKSPKKVKSGKKFAIKASIKNKGDAAASNVKVCIQTPTKLISGKAKRCVTIRSIGAGKTGTATFRLKAKKAAKKAKKSTRANFKVTAPTGDGSKKHTKTGHVSLLK